MQSSKLNNYIQILASFGVLVGLFVVAYELRQNTTIAAAEHSRELYLAWIDLASFENESNISEVLVRSVEQPDSLTAEDLYKLNSWFVSVLAIYVSGYEANEMGIPSQFSSLDETFATYLFASKYSRHWFERSKYWLGPENTETITRVIETTPVATKWQRLEEYYSQP